jgi:uncharacterized protein YukE
MASDEKIYPTVVLDMVADMRKIVDQVTEEMQVLSSNVRGLAGSSVSKAVDTFHEVQQQWNTLLDEHNRILTDVANETRQGYEDMIAFDKAAGFKIGQQ